MFLSEKMVLERQNVLEAIYISLVASSFRQVKQEDFINFDESFAKVDIL